MTWNGKWKKSWTLASGVGKYSISFIGKAMVRTSAPGNLWRTSPTPRKPSLSSINVTRIVRLPKTSPPILRLVAVAKADFLGPDLCLLGVLLGRLGALLGLPGLVFGTLGVPLRCRYRARTFSEGKILS